MEKIILKVENGQPVATEIKPVEVNGKRVLTTEQLAKIYGTTTDNIKVNFNNHKGNFKEGKHYYFLQGDELREFKNQVNDIYLVGKRAASLYLWTERGANRHCKILDTDKAWEQFDNLEETYFRVKENPYKGLSKEVQAIFAIDKKTQAIESRVNDLEDNMPLFNVECKELQALVRKTGIRVLGGYRTPAYKDNSLRGKVYADIQGQLKRQFGVSRYEAIKRMQLETAKEILENYRVPIVLENEIETLNNQVSF